MTSRDDIDDRNDHAAHVPTDVAAAGAVVRELPSVARKKQTQAELAAEMEAVLNEVELRDAKQAIYDAVPASSDLDLDPVTATDGPPQRAAKEILLDDRRNRKLRRDAERAQRKRDSIREAWEAANPSLYGALVGRTKIATRRVVVEANARRQALKVAAKASAGNPLLAQLNEGDERCVRAWSFQQLIRIETGQEPTFQAIGDRVKHLAGRKPGSRRVIAQRLIERAEALVAAGVWKPFDLLEI